MPAESSTLEPPLPVLDPPVQNAVLEPPAPEPPVRDELSPELAVQEGPPSLQRRVESALPWLTSLTVNLVLLVLLALLEGSGLLKNVPGLVEVSATFEESAEEALVELPDVSVTSASETTASFLAAPVEVVEPVATAAAMEISKDLLPALARANATFDTTLLDVPPQQRKGGLMGLPNSSDLSALVPSTTARGPITEKELRERTSLTDVAMDVGLEISEKLADDSLLVVWLLDGSLSLVDNRRELATYLDNMYAGLEQQLAQQPAPMKGQKKRILMNATVGYGAGVEVISKPDRNPLRATNAMREMGVDQTGLENVCQAITWTAFRAREGWDKRRGKIMIVVFTDESGNDLQYLEETIEACRYFQVSVSFIGPTAILGTSDGFHKYFHPQVAHPFWLPVMKGPDSGVPERLRLPYWWSTENLRTRLNIPANAQEFPTDRKIAAEWEAKLPEWARGAEVNPSDYFTGSYAGRELLNLNSGFPPYGLMRIARETGGTYTMFDRQGDRGPFRLELMRKYTPDYRSLPEIAEDMQHYPLRMAVVNSSMLTRQFAPSVTPRIHFWNGHLNPESFQAYCRKAMPAADEHAARTALLIEQALAGFGPNGMEQEYEQETSDRWKAWYDLNVGRLLLQSVRFAEYRATLQLLADPRIFPNQANQINLVPYPTIRAGEKSLQRAVLGEKLLKRCLEKNPGTPWAFLAARELEHPLSIDFNWKYIPPPPPSPPAPYRPSAPAPQITLPNL